MPVKDLAGQTFGRLTVLKLVGRKWGFALWECRCACGQIRHITSHSLICGYTQSCGCLRSEMITFKNLIHGRTGSAVYNTWRRIKSRCNNPKTIGYKYYGGRGIKICQRWNDSFEEFYSDMGDPPAGTSIDRINNDGDYEPGNCRWATSKEQANNIRKNVFVTYKNKTQTLAQWAEEYGINYQLLWQRLNTNKWTIEKALTTPIGRAGKK